MKPQIIRADRLNYDQRRQVDVWLKKNGCPWMVLADENVKITGQHFTVRTLKIKTVRQTRTLWPRHLPDDWTMPTKLRKYRIRHELKWDK